MARKIKGKVDSGKKEEKKVDKAKPKTKKSGEDDVIKYSYKKGGKTYLQEESVNKLNELNLKVNRIKEEISMLELKKSNVEKDKEILDLQKKLIDRELSDYKTGVFHKREDLNRSVMVHKETKRLIAKELGVKQFWINPDTNEVIFD